MSDINENAIDDKLVDSISESGFRKFMHVERLGHRATQGILEGTVYLMPKLDGTNGVVWFRDGEIRCGSRNNYLNPASGQDNHGFRAAMLADPYWPEFFAQHPHLIVYGEWLVPHTVKDYLPEAWRKFYVFDMFDTVNHRYLTPEEMRHQVAMTPDTSPDSCQSRVEIAFWAKLDSPTEAQLVHHLDVLSKIAMKEGKHGEGIVVKNYGWLNQDRHGRAWAKIIHPEFSNQGKAGKGVPKIDAPVDQRLVDKFVTGDHVKKTLAKIVAIVAEEVKIELPHDEQLWRGLALGNRDKVIPRLMGQVLSDLWSEEGWQIFKAAKGESISTSSFKALTEKRVKETLEWLF